MTKPLDVDALLPLDPDREIWTMVLARVRELESTHAVSSAIVRGDRESRLDERESIVAFIRHVAEGLAGERRVAFGRLADSIARQNHREAHGG